MPRRAREYKKYEIDGLRTYAAARGFAIFYITGGPIEIFVPEYRGKGKPKKLKTIQGARAWLAQWPEREK